jgi:hypothetical protein
MKTATKAKAVKKKVVQICAVTPTEYSRGGLYALRSDGKIFRHSPRNAPYAEHWDEVMKVPGT